MGSVKRFPQLDALDVPAPGLMRIGHGDHGVHMYSAPSAAKAALSGRRKHYVIDTSKMNMFVQVRCYHVTYSISHYYDLFPRLFLC